VDSLSISHLQTTKNIPLYDPFSAQIATFVSFFSSKIWFVQKLCYTIKVFVFAMAMVDEVVFCLLAPLLNDFF
jgi:hypothetical protein